MFISNVQVAIGGKSKKGFLDGTFFSTPPPFFQTTYLNCKVGENTYPIAFALLPNKLETTYREMLEKVKEVCEEQGVCLDFIYLHSDCEVAIINSVKAVFPNCQIRLCRFHIVDAIRRKANALGLRPIINRNDDFKAFYGRLREILNLPPHVWPQALDVVKGQLQPETKAIPAVQSFIEYTVS